jgi:hypothetical protein
LLCFKYCSSLHVKYKPLINGSIDKIIKRDTTNIATASAQSGRILELDNAIKEPSSTANKNVLKRAHAIVTIRVVGRKKLELVSCPKRKNEMN